jgi:hypothetical protein
MSDSTGRKFGINLAGILVGSGRFRLHSKGARLVFGIQSRLTGNNSPH